MKLRRSLVTTLALAAVAVPALAATLAPAHKRASPHETVSGVIGGARVTVTYGRPYTKDPKTGEPRKVWGGIVQAGHVWRMGADEATTLITEKPLAFGETTVPAGAYSLYLLPAEDGSAKLIVNKQLGQWGTVYNESQDLARIDLKKDAADPALDQFTMAVARDGQSGILKAGWDNVLYSAPFTVQK